MYGIDYGALSFVFASVVGLALCGVTYLLADGSQTKPSPLVEINLPRVSVSSSVGVLPVATLVKVTNSATESGATFVAGPLLQQSAAPVLEIVRGKAPPHPRGPDGKFRSKRSV